MGSKRCNKCYKDKEIEEFYFYTRLQRRINVCIECENLRSRAYSHSAQGQASKVKTKVKVREKRLAAYGITQADVDKMMESQNGKCGICSEAFSATNRMNVDHCHSSNQVRGLLCIRCNTALGGFRDNPKFLTAAITYLAMFNFTTGSL